MADEDTSGPRRVHYFNGQLLDAGDFTAEQDYHVDMRRRLNRFMHGAGVAGDAGLRVRKEGDRRLRIGAGVAIDAQGREIVLVADRLIDLDAVKAKAGTTVFLTLAYDEVLDVKVNDAGTASAVNHRRMAEGPRIDFVDKKPPDGDDAFAITLAAITIDAGGNIAEIDNTVRGFVGSVIDPKGELTVRGFTERRGNQKIGGKLDAAADVEVGANLGVAGNAELRGNVSARNLTVAAGAEIVSGLKVQGVCELRSNASVGVDLSVAQKFDVTGNATLRGGVTVNGDATLLGAVMLGSPPFSALGSIEGSARIVRGVVRADAVVFNQVGRGGFVVGSQPGWRVVKHAKGVYEITFDPPFPAPHHLPSAFVTPLTVDPGGKLPADIGLGNTAQFVPLAAMVFGIDNERLRVVIIDTKSNATRDAAFSFVVVGPR